MKRITQLKDTETQVSISYAFAEVHLRIHTDGGLVEVILDSEAAVLLTSAMTAAAPEERTKTAWATIWRKIKKAFGKWP